MKDKFIKLIENYRERNSFGGKRKGGKIEWTIPYNQIFIPLSEIKKIIEEDER